MKAATMFLSMCSISRDFRRFEESARAPFILRQSQFTRLLRDLWKSSRRRANFSNLFPKDFDFARREPFALAIIILRVHKKAVKVEFDPTKDANNRAKHGISLKEAVRFDWDTALEREDDRFDYGEVRFVAIGRIDTGLYVMVFTEGTGDDTVRIISLRPAEKHEKRFYDGQV